MHSTYPARGFCLAALWAALLLACSPFDEDGEKVSVTVEDVVLAYDRVRVIMAHENRRDTLAILFDGRLESNDALREMRVGAYDGGTIYIFVEGYEDGELVYLQEMLYDGRQGKFLHRIYRLTPDAEVRLPADTVLLKVGETQILRASTSPANLADSTVEWTLSDASVAALAVQSGRNSGHLSAKADGRAVLMVRLQAMPHVMDSLIVVVGAGHGPAIMEPEAGNTMN